ncbi:ankyrin repeat domain-containing protein 54 [Episyrphus balteatus]|uniref:ankyrin repeat domain-containing protein 54 n=1 Tax=Episyrphus balteatus TaxID=286459 RepID=UPI002486AB5C|nr:ankyrin repeat domain-containing protein 54 [Episyrphus balteatus]
MASNDSGVDTSNDSNDGNNFILPTIPLVIPNLHNFNLLGGGDAGIGDDDHSPQQFAQPQPKPSDMGALMRPSSLPSGSSSLKLRCRKRIWSRLSGFANIQAEMNGRRLRLAASTCNVELLTRMLEKLTDPNSSDEHKRSPLHLAACRGYDEIVSLLLRFGANPNIVDSLGNTPLHLAVISASSNNFNQVVRILLQGGASLHVYDRSGKTPFELAESKWRLLKLRYQNPTPEKEKILEDMCLLISLMLRYLCRQKQDIDDLDALESRLKNLSTEDQVAEADALLASVEKMSLK